MAPSKVEKDLRITFGKCNRLHKEVLMYEREIEDQRKVVERFRADSSKDAYEIKQQENALVETEQVLPGSKHRLAMAHKELQDFISENKDNIDCTDAQTLVDKVSQYLE